MKLRRQSRTWKRSVFNFLVINHTNLKKKLRVQRYEGSIDFTYFSQDKKRLHKNEADETETGVSRDDRISIS